MNPSDDPTYHPDPEATPPPNPVPPPTPPLESSAPTPEPGRVRSFVHAVSPPPPDSRSKSPALAGFLSLIPGLGQIYVGYYTRGFVHAIVVSVLITTLVNLRDEDLIPLFLLPLIFFWLYNIIDATRRAALYNQYLAGAAEIELPDELPAFKGSVFGGSMMILAGVAILTRTRFGMSLDWIREWWPIAPIVFGAWLIYRAVQDRDAG